ncbi:putative protein kinase RLK-Pelle-LRR-IX family [Helianthus debilis subsp. tardiflorus]
MIISVQVLKKCDQNFAKESELGHGGFGVVYKGQLDDGTKIAVKRMESGVICNKALDEFESEISVLTKVRHRHLVLLLGYSTQVLKRILVYEYMPQGIEYLHSLAHQSFIHQDLKSSNILLSDDFRANVSDFGPVKLVPDGGKSIMAQVAGMFVYVAPKYAKSDIGYFGSDFRIRIVLNTSNFHTTSLLIAATPVTPSASMVDYHRHTCTLILTITHIYTFLISIIFSTTDPNVLNELQKGLDLSNNNFSPPQLNYKPFMKLVLSGNPLFQSNSSKIPPKPSSPLGLSPTAAANFHLGLLLVLKKPNVVPSLTPVAAFAGLELLTFSLGLYLCKLKKANSSEPPNSLVIHPLYLFNSDDTVRISITKDTQKLASVGSGSSESHVIKSGNMIISVQVLKKCDQNFAKESELGHGGFGVVYKGQLDDGTKIAVKRMESGVICNKALDEFESEISVLTKVRHRYLVLLLGYSTQVLKRILVYEYMPQGIEYLHSLAHQSFIHQDLKSSNILLNDDFRANVSDFGPVKLVPDGGKSIMAQVVGIFGYVAPKYASNYLFSLYTYIYEYIYIYQINFWHGSSKKL